MGSVLISRAYTAPPPLVPPAPGSPAGPCRPPAGDAVDLAEYNDPQLAAALMKGFFRELAEPLLTFELYSSFLEFMAAGDLDAQVAACKVKQCHPLGGGCGGFGGCSGCGGCGGCGGR